MTFNATSMLRRGGVQGVYAQCTHRTPPLHTKSEAL